MKISEQEIEITIDKMIKDLEDIKNSKYLSYVSTIPRPPIFEKGQKEIKDLKEEMDYLWELEMDCRN